MPPPREGCPVLNRKEGVHGDMKRGSEQKGLGGEKGMETALGMMMRMLLMMIIIINNNKSLKEKIL